MFLSIFIGNGKRLGMHKYGVEKLLLDLHKEWEKLELGEHQKFCIAEVFSNLMSIFALKSHPKFEI